MINQITQNLQVNEMSLETFRLFQSLIYAHSGISLADSKKALLMNRISKRMRTLRLLTPEDYFTYVKTKDIEELQNLIDVVSTNTTHFFREQPHFDFLESLCAQWTKDQKKNIKIWCAASSSGEEPYTISMVLKECLSSQVEYRILATDICTDVLLQASAGRYSHREIVDIPSDLLSKYFEKLQSDEGALFEANKHIRSNVTFKRLNLSDFPYPLKGGLDVIFCRNVMIYFDRPMRQKVVDEFYRLLSPGGYLVLSHSENVLGITHSFKSLGSSIYRK